MVRTALFVGGVAVGGGLLARRYRRNYPGPTPYHWSLMWEQATRPSGPR